MRRYYSPCRTQRQAVARDAKGSAGTNDREGSKLDPITFEPGILRREGGHIYEGKAGTIRANAGDNQLAVAYGLVLYNLAVTGDVAASLTTATGQGALNTGPSVCLEEKREQYLFDNHAMDSRYKGPLSITPTLAARLGTGGNNSPLVVKTTLKAQGGVLSGGSKNLVGEQKYTKYIVRRLTPTECARLQGFPDLWGHPDKKEDFTDDEYKFWLDVRNTHAALNGRKAKEYTKAQMLTWYNKLHTDSSEYKMWGNGIALPCAVYVMQGIVQE